jgi:prolyl oligopeptidase
MKIKTIIETAAAAVILTACGNEKPAKEMSFKYPETKKDSTVSDTFFGKVLSDPYRWLEDDRSKETEDWVKRQNEFTFDYLKKIPYRETIKDRLSKLWNFEKLSAPFFEGGIKYFYKNDGLQNQSVLYAQKNGEEAKIFLDPNTFSKDGTTSLGSIDFSKDGKIAAYAISEGGSDWRKVIVINAETKTIMEDTLVDIKFSGVSWKGNEGFYYSSYDKPKGSELSAKTDQHKLYYHKLGTKQKDDVLIFGGTAEQKRRYIVGSVTEDGKYLFISAAVSTSGNELYMKDLSKPNSPTVQLIKGYESDSYVLDNVGSKLYIVTNLNAPNQKIVTADATKPSSENWKDFIGEKEFVLAPSTGSGYIFAHYMVDATSKVEQYDYEGKLIRKIELPGIGTADGFSAKKEEKEIYYSYTNYNTPRSIYKLNPAQGKSEIYWSPKIDFKAGDYESKQVFYASKDGTKIPMIITYKKGIKLDGKNPTILYAYGGFNVSLTPAFSTPNAVWLEMGGIYAVANLRGGGEYGKKWHDAGTQMKKQNVFDDFIAAAEYLIKEKYTSSDFLAINGGSNGGLLVGATMTQRPELMKVAIPEVGVLDMLRYHTFTAGAGWAYDYGTAEDSKEMFEYLLKYSPVHNAKSGVKYPATLITTGDHDDRVVPAHSFKFAAALQASGSSVNPLMIRIETNAGHGAGTPVSKIIEAEADVFAFILYNFGIKKLKL